MGNMRTRMWGVGVRQVLVSGRLMSFFGRAKGFWGLGGSKGPAFTVSDFGLRVEVSGFGA